MVSMQGKDFEKFRRVFSRLTPVEKKMPIVKIGKDFLSWEDIYKKMASNEKNAKKALARLKEMGLI